MRPFQAKINTQVCKEPRLGGSTPTPHTMLWLPQAEAQTPATVQACSPASDLTALLPPRALPGLPQQPSARHSSLRP